MKKIFLIFIILIPSLWFAEFTSDDCPGVDSSDKKLCEFVNTACAGSGLPYYNEDNKILKEYIKYNGLVWEHTNNSLSNYSWDLFANRFLSFRNSSPFKISEQTYKTNMANIYECAISQIKIQEIDIVINKILVEAKTTSAIIPKLERQKNALTREVNKKCNLNVNWIDPEDKYSKNDLLKETTYEMCKYISHLSYLEWVYSKTPILEDILPKDDPRSDSYKLTDLYAVSEMQKKVNEEINHTLDVYETAFKSYADYENNYQVHIYLELIKSDLHVYRTALHDVMVPLNQLPSKIIWAMSTGQ